MPTTKRAALYLRVSTDEQTTENQRLALRDEAQRRGWSIVVEYQDEGISGAKGRDKRPGLDRMLRDATRGKFDVLMIWALDRLGRSLADLLRIADDLHRSEIDLYIRGEAIDTTTASGRLFFHMMGAIAEFERGRIQERIHAGIARARREGKKLGRARLPHEKAQRVRNALARGMSVRDVASLTGVSKSKVAMIGRAARASSQSVESAPASSSESAPASI